MIWVLVVLALIASSMVLGYHSAGGLAREGSTFSPEGGGSSSSYASTAGPDQTRSIAPLFPTGDIAPPWSALGTRRGLSRESGGPTVPSALSLPLYNCTLAAANLHGHSHKVSPIGLTLHVSIESTLPESESKISSVISARRSGCAGRMISRVPRKIPLPSPWFRVHFTRHPCLLGSRNQGT
jgi:hypothetical protein